MTCIIHNTVVLMYGITKKLSYLHSPRGLVYRAGGLSVLVCLSRLLLSEPSTAAFQRLLIPAIIIGNDIVCSYVYLF